jgi:RHS repeat-associated protein
LGLDLAGSLTATGGVGAALSSTSYSISSSSDTLTPATGGSHDTLTLSYLYDGNGNVIATCDAIGNIVDKISYSPFGEIVGEKSNIPFSFSTKSSDASVYYGFRFYSPEMGRWMSRDPIGEMGEINIYGFAMSSPLNSYDYLGLDALGALEKLYTKITSLPLVQRVVFARAFVQVVKVVLIQPWITIATHATSTKTTIDIPISCPPLYSKELNKIVATTHQQRTTVTPQFFLDLSWLADMAVPVSSVWTTTEMTYERHYICLCCSSGVAVGPITRDFPDGWFGWRYLSDTAGPTLQYFDNNVGIGVVYNHRERTEITNYNTRCAR